MLKYIQLSNPLLNGLASAIWVVNIINRPDDVVRWVVLVLQLAATVITAYVAWTARSACA